MPTTVHVGCMAAPPLQSRIQHKGTPAELYFTLQQFKAQARAPLRAPCMG